jgi:hypothetical protein
VPLEGLRRLALADLDEETLRGLIEQGEHLLVERKQAPPEEAGLGEAVSSFANTVGGWLLLGVADDGSIVGWEPPGRSDAQAHLGELLRVQVDPLPPFVAGEREFDGKKIVVVRVFESADTPHIVKPTGGVYVRTSKGKEPVLDQTLLLELARRGEEARDRAMKRLRSLDVINEAIAGTVDAGPFRTTPHALVYVRAGPLTVTPQFSEWALSRSAVDELQARALELASALGIDNADPSVEPHGRGIEVHWIGGSQIPVEAVLVVDSGGVVAARIRRGSEPDNRFSLGQLKPRFLKPLIDAVAGTLTTAEAYGRSTWDTLIGPAVDDQVSGVPRQPPAVGVHASADLLIPAEAEELEALAAFWARHFARECGQDEWEAAEDD